MSLSHSLIRKKNILQLQIHVKRNGKGSKYVCVCVFVCQNDYGKVFFGELICQSSILSYQTHARETPTSTATVKKQHKWNGV